MLKSNSLKLVDDYFTIACWLGRGIILMWLCSGSVAFARVNSPLPQALANISQYRGQNNLDLYFYVTGSNAGNVWGNRIYTDDSSLAKATVHAGILAVDQAGVVKVTILPGQSDYIGATTNGVSSNSYFGFLGSYMISADDGGDNPIIPAPADLSQFKDNIGDAYLFMVKAEATGNIWGTNVYTLDSTLHKAVIHAGLLNAGETGVVRVIIAPGQNNYIGSSQNGVTANGFSQYRGSYVLANENGSSTLADLPGSYRNPFTNPGDLAGLYQNIGATYYFKLTGDNNGSLWGSNPYTSDSSLTKAAQHSGLLAINQTGVIKVTILPGLNSYPASTQNGVTSTGYGVWSASFAVASPDGSVGDIPLISSPESINFHIGLRFNYQITATKQATTFNAVGLPKGLSINSATGTISGTPQLTGRFVVALQASNKAGTGWKSLMLASDKQMQAGVAIAAGSFAEPNNSPQQATPILINDRPLLQTLSGSGDDDWFEFYAKAGKAYTIQIAGSSVGAKINPAIYLYDANGALLISQTARSSSNDKQIVWQPTTKGLYRIKVNNLGLSAKAGGNEAGGDDSFQLRVFLTDAPQQGIVKGVVLDNCTGQGLAEAEVSSFLNNSVTDSTLTFKTGEFGLPLNPDQYDIKGLINDYQEGLIPVTVTQEDIANVNLNLIPEKACPQGKSIETDPTQQSQQAAVVYDASSGLLVFKDVIVGDTVYYAELVDTGNFRFKLLRYFTIPGVIHTEPSEYNLKTGLVSIPSVFALNKIWKVQLKFDEASLFLLNKAEQR